MFKPVNDKILVKKHVQDKTEGGIHIPTNIQTDLAKAEIIGVGSGTISGGKRFTPSVKEGDIVLYRTAGETLIKGNDGDDYHLITELMVQGIFADESPEA